MILLFLVLKYKYSTQRGKFLGGVWICKKVVTCDEMICGRDIWCWQVSFFWISNDKCVFGAAIEVLAKFISQICIGISVTDDFYRFVASYGTVVGSNDDAIICLCQCLKEFTHCSVAEP